LALGNLYLTLLSVGLAGYAILGRGFAYVGFPSVHVGELYLALGIVVVLRCGCTIGIMLLTTPACVLAIAMLWVLLRTIPFIGTYGMDALRDSATILYGGFSFVVIALLLQQARRINTSLVYYARFAGLLALLAPVALIISRYLVDFVPRLPGTNVPIIQIQATEMVVHLTGAAVFAIVGFRVARPLWMMLIFVSAVFVGTVSRGSMLAEVVPITAALLVLGRWRELVRALGLGMLIFCLAYVVEPLFFTYVEAASSEDRPVSTRQIVENFISITAKSGEQAAGTESWRLDWWKYIIKDTVFGPHFWAGRGFGLNIAIADGFSNWNPNADRPPLRSPHNIQMMLLARAGVPGLILWLCFVASWFGMMIRAFLTANRQRHTQWSGLFLFTGCYIGSAIIDASFDPVLEGPMMGIWFWSLIGFGIGSVMVYRHQLATNADSFLATQS
jgi:hypothetical protein